MQHTVPSFRTGKHITDKDRPRMKNWKREYEKDRESGRYNDTDPGSFLLPGERRYYTQEQIEKARQMDVVVKGFRRCIRSRLPYRSQRRSIHKGNGKDLGTGGRNAFSFYNVGNFVHEIDGVSHS